MDTVLLIILLYFAIHVIVGYMGTLSLDGSEENMDYCMNHCSYRSPDPVPYDYKLCYEDNVSDSIAHNTYSRMPLASERRQSHNDIYINRRLEGRQQFYEFGFKQDYLLKVYHGSSLVEEHANHRNESCYSYSITFVSQTTYLQLKV